MSGNSCPRRSVLVAVGAALIAGLAGYFLYGLGRDGSEMIALDEDFLAAPEIDRLRILPR